MYNRIIDFTSSDRGISSTIHQQQNLNATKMIFGCCFLMTITISAMSLSAPFVYAFQPYYYQQHLHRRQHQQHKIGNYVQREHYYRRSFQLFYAKTDPSIIAYNRQYLIDTLGFSEEKVDKIKTSVYNILTLEIGVLDERVNWLKDRLDLKENQTKKITQQQPTILGMKTSSLIPKLDYLATRLLLDRKALRKMILLTPSILGMSTEDNIKPKLNYLQQKLRLDDKALKKLVLAANVFCASTEENIDPKLNWLQERLMLDDEELAKIITRRPAILQYSLEDNIEPTLDWLQQRLGLDDTELSKMIKRLPHILGYSILDNMDPKLDWLQQRLSLTDEELSKLIQQTPPLFNCNIDTNIEPTLNFYIDALGDESKALAFVTRDPSSLGRSLEKRLKPRLEEARDVGMIINSKFLNTMMKYTEDDWNKRVLKEMRNTDSVEFMPPK